MEKLGVVGSGAIASGLAATAAQSGDVVLWARSQASADRARATIDKTVSRFKEPVDPARVTVTTDLADLADATAIVEAVVEEHDAKVAVLRQVLEHAAPDALIGTTTSSLSVARLAEELGIGERFIGLHVFNPVPRMKLVELAYPQNATEETRERASALCAALDKEAVDVPDLAGFVVNRLLFPYLFSAVDFMEETGLPPASIDTCMQLGAAHPMGPIALLDYIGLDVSVANGDAKGANVPQSVRAHVAGGVLGRKTGRGLYPPEFYER